MRTNAALFISPAKARRAGEHAVVKLARRGRPAIFDVQPHMHLNRDGSADHGYRVALFSPGGTRLGWVS